MSKGKELSGVLFKNDKKTTDKHPLYKALTSAAPDAEGAGPMRERFKERGRVQESPSDVLWNFEKFLIGRDGKVVARFAPSMTPGDERVVGAIDEALAQSA